MLKFMRLKVLKNLTNSFNFIVEKFAYIIDYITLYNRCLLIMYI